MNHVIHLVLLAFVIIEDIRHAAKHMTSLHGQGRIPGLAELQVAPLAYYSYEFVALLIHT